MLKSSCIYRGKSGGNKQTMGRTEIKAVAKASGAGASGPTLIMWELSAMRQVVLLRGEFEVAPDGGQRQH